MAVTAGLVFIRSELFLVVIEAVVVVVVAAVFVVVVVFVFVVVIAALCRSERVLM